MGPILNLQHRVDPLTYALLHAHNGLFFWGCLEMRHFVKVIDDIIPQIKSYNNVH